MKNHKLIRWRLVIHGCIDGFSRLVVFLNCAPNNRAKTVLEQLLTAVESFRMPLKIRTDHGTENVEVARFLLEHYGVETRPVITGKSVHYQRIEILWVDVFIYVTQQFWNIFHFLECHYDMDAGNELHLFVLHFVNISRINKKLREFSVTWNYHPVRTEKNCTPMQIWTEGFYSQSNLIKMTYCELSMFGIDHSGLIPEIQTANNVQIPDIDIDLSPQCKYYIVNNFDPLENDGNYGIDLFTAVLAYLVRNL